MKAMSIVLFVLLLASLSQAQQRWERAYGGGGQDKGNSVQQTSDEGYIITGYTYSFGVRNGDVYLIKTNASGDTLWTRTYGRSGYDVGKSVQQTSDGGYIIVGELCDSLNPTGVYLIKINLSGGTQWSQIYLGGEGFSVQQTSDSGYIIAGYRNVNDDVWLIKTNASGDTLWTKAYGGANYDWGYSVQQTSDSGYIIAGTTSSFGSGNNDVYLIKTDVLGDTLWTKTYGGTNSDEGYSVQQTSDGGYIIAGYTRSFGPGSYDVYLIKTNASGDTFWTKTYGGTNDDEGHSVQQTSDGGYIIAGYTGTGDLDVFLIKTNAFGETLWTRTYGGRYNDAGFSIQQTSDGGYVIAGVTESFGMNGDVYLIKTDSLGRSTGVEEDRQGDKETRGQGERLRATPNPFTSFATLPGHEAERFNLYDVSGRKVGTYRGDRVGEGLAPGVYFVRPESGYAKPLRIVKVK
jgi:hypothetical protein